MKNNATFIYNICLVAADFLALLIAFVGAFVFRVSLSDVPVLHPIHATTYLAIFASLLPFWILIFALLGLYNSSIYERRFSEFGRLLLGSFIGLLFLIFWNFVSVEPIFPAKLIPFYGFALGFVVLVLFRNIARAIRTMLFGYAIGVTKLLVVGNTSVSDELRHSLADSHRSGYKILGVVGDKSRPFHADFDSFEQALKHLRRSPLHGILQTELYADEARNRAILNYAQEHHINYRFVPGNTELFVGNIDVELFRNSMPVIAVRQTPLFGWGRVAKRAFDVVFGLLGIIITAIPMLVIVIIMKLTEPRSKILYKPQRISRFGKSFEFYKFRSMYQKYCVSPEEGFTLMGRPDLLKQYRDNGDVLTNDPRVTPLGRFIRKTSLDELPQLFNVLKGDISLVGPRALDTFEMERYDKKNLILAVKTGITGLAVVSGRSNIPVEERRKIDLYYVQNWSFWLDLIIIVKTIRVVLSRSGAR